MESPFMRNACKTLAVALACSPCAALAVDFDDDRFLEGAPPSISLFRSGAASAASGSFFLGASYIKRENGSRQYDTPFILSYFPAENWSFAIVGDAYAKVEPAHGDSLSGFGDLIAKVSHTLPFGDRLVGGLSAGVKIPTAKEKLGSSHSDAIVGANLKVKRIASELDAISVGTVATRVGGERPEGVSQFAYTANVSYATLLANGYGLAADFLRKGRGGGTWRSEASLVGKKTLASNATVSLRYSRGLTTGLKSNFGQIGVEFPFQ